MSLLNPFPAFLLIAVAILFIYMLSLWDRRDKSQAGRFASIDGLRGYLAFSVFIHHASIWFNYARFGTWEVPQSNLYTQLGESSVSLFFMITSFLFYNKLLDSRGRTFDWTAFFVGRFFRLTPLYLLAMCALFAIVGILSNGVLVDSTAYIFKCMLEWLTFTVVNNPDINHVQTRVIVAGVTWSLPYEWIFYFALPLLGLFAGHRVRLPLILLGFAALSVGAMTHLALHMLFVFASGAIAAVAVRNDHFRNFAKTKSASIVVLMASVSMTAFPTAYGLPQLLPLTLAFCLIACGCSVFGCLTHQLSRRLGDLAYSIYLLHGIVLFVALHFIVGRALVAAISPFQYWMVIAALVPVLITCATLTFRYIEQPGINMTRIVLAKRKRAESPVTV